MDVEIGEIESMVRVSDQRKLLEPEILERIIAAVLVRLNEKQAGERRSDKDRTLFSNVTGENRTW